MSYKRVLFEVADGVVTITLNRPEKRNALDGETVRELKQALASAEASDDARVVLLRANGPDFCAGADLSELERIAAGGGSIDNLRDAQSLGDLFIAMRHTSRPIIAAVQGNAIAGGAGLATAADLIVASDNAVFGYPEVHLGFVPAMVMALLRRAVGEKITFDLAATGRRFGAEEAQRLGLVSRVVPAARLDGDAIGFARELAGRSASALALIKRLLYGIDGVSFEEAIARGAEVNAIARATPDCQAGVRRFLERRRPER
jgi:methylglutaconyl-CoA hydratase